MKQFSRWSGIAHSVLSQHSPKIKLGQVHQLIAACLGHRTYASLRDKDLAVLDERPAYVLFDVEAGLRRSIDLDLALTEAQWHEATMALRPSGITPFWLTSMQGMHGAARLTFEDSGDDRIEAIKREIGFPDGHWVKSSRNHVAEDQLPELLRFDVDGEIQAYTDDSSLAVPVKVVVEFPKLGRRIYGKGTLVSVEKCGDARPSDREDALDGGDFYWMSED
ncbi:hypothetical protein [Kinneretia aquatilis]|uniref:hypothetical protein n=1 Tax=Kinneretia aquatilis TaxID=2070761 RepID=UPI0014952878|nr:hypothetical protein [Paucibacter aquatile]WIV96874.1 hypothetical protein K9V56_017845 [Paucibacter aquatile]